MLLRARSLARVAVVVLVAVPILFGLIDGATGVLIGLAFSGLVVVVAAAAYGVLTLVTRRIDRLEERLVKVASRTRRGRSSRRTWSPCPGCGPSSARSERASPSGCRTSSTSSRWCRSAPASRRSGCGPRPPTCWSRWSTGSSTERPATVIEGGSGVSTVVMALAVREHNLPTRIVALEHQPEWAEVTRRLLERHGVAEYAEVRLAPLAPTSLDDHETPWYDESALADLSDIGLVLVDGPPEGTGERARYPMVPLLRDRFAPRCTILVDDTDRPGDADVVERWRPLLPDFEFGVLDLDKGAAILTRK